jgi:hypothetical protein
MPHARRNGTAWDRTKDDYAYTRNLDRTGWAWEFLRRNKDYQRDYRLNRAGHPIAFKHGSGATLYKLPKKSSAAEAWGLEAFADPDFSVEDLDLFWRSTLLTHQANCSSSVLVDIDHEQIVFRERTKTAALHVSSGTSLLGDCRLTFHLEGINSSKRHHETMQILKSFLVDNVTLYSQAHRIDSKYLHYLIALDGHLEGRSYREIALVLYGKAAVGAYWTDDTRGLKSKVRRAVDRGLALMNGGYRGLL